MTSEVAPSNKALPSRQGRLAIYAVVGTLTSFLMPFAAGLFGELASEIFFSLSIVPFWLPAALVPLVFGLALGRKAPLPDSFFWRYLPLVSPLLVVQASIFFDTLLRHTDHNSMFLGLIIMAAFNLWALYLAAFAIGSFKRRSVHKLRGALLLVGLLALSAGACVLAWQYQFTDLFYGQTERASVGHGVNTLTYTPYQPDNKLVTPVTPPSLHISSHFPRLDGAIAAAPVYGAIVQAVYARPAEQGEPSGQVLYEGENIYFCCSNTQEGYRRLIHGEADIFFGNRASPSLEQEAREAGVELIYTPIAREAFVFFVNKDNPVTNLSLEQIRQIYSGETRNWTTLGGKNEKILAFQRPESSGSQSAMLSMVMGDTPMIEPLTIERQGGMGDIIQATAEYRNRYNALGYSFRWYATVQFTSPDIRMLAVDGVLPTEENIRNGSYPFTMPVLAVTTGPLSQEGEDLMEWILSKEGQDLIQRTGYVPLA